MNTGTGKDMVREADVIVVGAGMSGLRAAKDLVGLGHTVIVLEAKDRVGGRVKAAELAGRKIDLGGQWVGPHQTELRGEAARLGIQPYPQNFDGDIISQLGGHRARLGEGSIPDLDPEAMAEMAMLTGQWTCDFQTLPADAPWTAPDAQAWDSQTVESWIVANLKTPEARSFARLIPRTAWAADSAQISYLWFMDVVRSGEGLEGLMGGETGNEAGKYLGGMHQIAARLADELGERVVLNAAVTQVVQEDGGVRVETAGGTWRARYLILAGPPGPMNRIHFEPTLPTPRDALQQRMPAGTIIKFWMAYETDFWRADGYSGQVSADGPTIGLVMDDTQPGGVGMLVGFFAGEHAVRYSGADKATRQAVAVEALVDYFGPLAASPIGYEDNDWCQEPWTWGYVGSMGPGTMTRFGAALREPVGPIHWAGTETATEFAGYIEGALRSGSRAAGEVAKLLAASPVRALETA
ncbi:MAG: hypothetical protein JWR84_3787 [Caulobacter sp.]|nr:hypothetical protein [Caulobacter sp.]